MKTLIILVALALSIPAHAEDKYYVVFGQSNAGGIANYGKLDEKLSNATDTAHIVPCWKGGTELSKFMPSYDIASIYGECLKKIGTNKISGIVFWQGERDASRLTEVGTKTPVATSWMARVTTIIRTLRQDINQGNIPVVVVLMNDKAHTKTFPYWKSIRNLQQRISAPNVMKVDSSPYGFNNDACYPGDAIHLTQSGYDAISLEISGQLSTK
jgi:hypothetical protein